MSQLPYEGIAIIGMSGRFPGADSVETFWANLVAGTDSVSFFDDRALADSGLDGAALRQRGHYVAARGVLDGIDLFDAAFFGIPPTEAEVMDPQHRLFLETCWTALEAAGYAPNQMPGVVGVFGGVTYNTYYHHVLQPRPDLRELVGADMVMFGNERDYLTTRVAFKLGLTGPAVNVSTACSTSLVAVCQACHALLAYQCDSALAGGASITVPQQRGYFHDEGNIGSADGRTRTFDEQSAGTVFSNGVAIVVLKRLEDAVRDGDQVYAVIKGAAINNDGSQRVSFGAPGVQGQADVIAMAHALAGVEPDTISYVEAHGTATPLGDPIEIAGLTRAFRLGTAARQFCAIGSVKTNIGHLDVASGVTGLIKTALALHHRVIPASLHFTRANPKLELESSPFYVNAERREWTTPPGMPRRAGVSSFGTGGTNAHVVVEEAPELRASGPSRATQLLVLSAKTPDALEHATDNLATHLGQVTALGTDAAAAALADAAFTLQTGRSSFTQRRVVLCTDAADGEAALRARDPKRVATHVQRLTQPPVIFMFPGQGAQYAGMGAELYRAEPVFRDEVDRCADLLMPQLGADLRAVMFPAGSDPDAEQQLTQTRFAQPALFVIEYALARLWMSWGIEPAAMIGHSVGEYVAACLAGVFTLEDALALVAQRGEMVQALPGGSMLAVRLSEFELLPLVDDELAIAAINAPRLCVVAGPHEAIAALEAELATRGVSARRLNTSHAFHSAMMDPVVAAFTDRVQRVPLAAPRIPFVSNVTARWITAAEAQSPAYWAQHLRHAVRFADGLAEIMADGRRILLEVGPGQTLSTLARQHPAKATDQTVLSSLPSRDQEPRGLMHALGTLWMVGAAVDWDGVHRDESRRRVVLPTYPFERTRHWPDPLANFPSEVPAVTFDQRTAVVQIEPAPAVSNATGITAPPLTAVSSAVSPPARPRRARLMDQIRFLLEQISGMSLADADPSAPFVALGLDSLLLTQVGSKLRSDFGVRVSFRQLMEELSSLETLAAHLDGVLPIEMAAPAVDSRVPVATVAPSSAPAPLAAPQAALAGPPQLTTATIEALLAQQQELTNHVLGLLRQQAVAAPDPASAAAPLASRHTRPAPGIEAPAPAVAAPPAIKSSGPFQAIERSASTTFTAAQQGFLDALITRYTARTGRSKQHTERYRKRLADPRTMAGFRAYWKELVYPLVIERSSGSRMWDIDGNEYVDFTMGFGTNLLGHSPPFVTAAIEEQLRKGIEVGPQTPLAGEVAELMCELTGMERCAFANTGSEAVLAAVRVARTVTGRNRIVYFTGDYHGIFDEVLQRVSGRPGDQRLMAAAPGIPVQSSEHVLILDYDKPESLDIIRAGGADIAAVIVEPVQSRYPDLQPREFLRQLREVTQATGSALVFDEVISGFRAHPGGVQALFGVRADMATYGKVIGGGLPIGALCGSASWLDALDGGAWQYGDQSIPESGVTFFAGTYVRHPLAIAGAWATLSHLKREGPGLQQALSERMTAVVQELAAFLLDREAPLRIEHFASLFWVRFDPRATYANLLFFLLRDKGIHIFEGRLFFLSTAHSEADVRHLVRAFKDSVIEMQAAGFLSGKTAGTDSLVAAGRAPLMIDRAVASATPAPALVLARPAAPAVVPAAAPTAVTRPMKFGAYFFGTYDAAFTPDKYQLLLDTATFADAHGFSAIWLPERHFHPVGGLSPNPVVIAAALATITTNIHLRAGSVVLPLHNPIRVAEEWSVVDNLSKGRVGLSIASGWHPNDFVFAPEAYDRRRELCAEGMEVIQRLWAGESVAARGGTGQELNVSLYPMPMQRTLPMWMTCVQAGSYQKAGELGAGVLAMLTNQTLGEVAEKIALYRSALVAHGHDPAVGNVTLLIHTFVGESFDAAVATARGPMREYLRSYLGNSQTRRGATDGAAPLEADDLEYLLDRSFDDYMQGKCLIGTPETCAVTVAALRDIGVDELGCFLDFGVDAASVLTSLPFLDALKRRCSETITTDSADVTPAAASGRVAEPQLAGAMRQAPVPTPRSPVPTPQVRDAGAAGVLPQREPLVLASSSARRTPAATLPMTESQQGLALLTRLAPAGNRAYAEVTTLRLRGALDVDALGGALQMLVDRHEGLRTSVDADGERQTVHPHATLRVPLVDLSRLPDSERAVGLAEELAEVEAYTFDFAQAPVLRARLLRLADDHHLLVLTFHHLFGNGPSYAVFFDELCDLYTARRDGAATGLAPAMQLTDYVHWRAAQLDTPAFEEDRAFWHAQFADTMPVLDLPADHARPAVMTYRGGRQSITIGAALTTRLRSVSGTQRASLFMTLFAAFNVLLHRLSGADDVVVGVPFEGEVRAEPGGDHLFANTTNMIPFRSRIRPDASFAELLRETKALVLEAGEHQAYFFGRLLQDLKVRPDLSRPPMFAASFNLERGTFHRSCGALDVALLIEDVPFGNPRGAAKFELALNIADTGRELRLDCDYSSDLFEPATVARWLGHYETLLDGIAADQSEIVDRLPILRPAERAQIAEWNRTDAVFAGPQTLDALFERQVDLTPDATAITFDDSSLTYRELDRRANQLAHYLQARGAGPEQLVGICAERSLEMVIGLLGILKSGAAYVPIDPAYPHERIAFMLADAAVTLLLTQQRLRDELPRHQADTICLDTGWAAIAAERSERPVHSSHAGTLAYMIYTSGSTGRPKGALNTHGAIVNRLHWMQGEYRLGADDRVLQKTPFSFDVSVWEFFWPLITGARLVVARPGGHQAPDYLVQLITRERITVCHFVPSMLRVFLETPTLASCVSLRDVICSGEALTPDVVEAFYEALPATLHNLYGPTEAAVDVTYWECRRDDHRSSIPIGRPVANTQCYILDARLEPVPIGVMTGELHLGGVQVGRGYHRQPALTADRFIPDPFSGRPGARLYKTGDLCRYLADGTIEYLGRMDHQVKVRGFRIELGEIEAALGRHPAVTHCVVVAREDTPGDQRLVAYVESQAATDTPADEWRAHLASTLPEFMIPSAFVMLEALPLTASGKIDRRALPPPAGRTAAVIPALELPRSDTTRRLAAIWQDLLGVREVGVRDDFFRLGGHSLLAMRLVNRVHDAFGVDLPPSALFEHPVLGDLARLIEPVGLSIVKPAAAPPVIPASAVAARRASSGTVVLSQKVLIQMEAGGAGTPFFWVHGVGGEVFNCMQVSRHLAPARPVYGFAADWTKMSGFETLSLDVIAAAYVRELRDLRPAGPYHLGGLCAGAKLALEMARQLEAAGEQVGVLVVIDCDLQPIGTSPTGLGAVPAFLRNLPRWLREDAFASGARDLIGRVRSRVRRANAASRSLWTRGGTSGAAQADLRDRLGMWRFPDYQVAMLKLHHQTIESYEPRAFGGAATIFVPLAVPLFGPWPRSYDPSWDRLAQGGVELHRVHGSHSTMMANPYAADLAGRLNAAIVASEWRARPGAADDRTELLAVAEPLPAPLRARR